MSILSYHFKDGILLAFAFVCFCCKEVPDEPPLTDIALTGINGRIESWNAHDYGLLLAHSWFEKIGYEDPVAAFEDTCLIDADGSFLITFQEPLPEGLSKELHSPNLSSSNAEAKFIKCSFLIIDSAHVASRIIYNSNRKISGNPDAVLYLDIGDYYAYYEYADRDVYVSGTDTTLGHYTGRRLIKHSSKSYVKGWNRIVTRYTTMQDSTTFAETFASNVNEGKWFMQNVGSSQ